MKETSETIFDAAKSEVERFVYLNVALSNKGVAEYSGERCVIFVPRDQIVRIESRIGSHAERPLVQAIAGAILGGLGLLGVYMAITAGLYLLRWEAGFVIFGGLGFWLLYEAMRRGHYLVVMGPKEPRKIVFKGKVQPPQLQEFLSHAKRLGYDCQCGLL